MRKRLGINGQKGRLIKALYASGIVIALGGGLLLKLYSTNIRIRNGVWQTDY